MEAIFEEMAKNQVKLVPAQGYPTLIQLEHSDWRSQFPPESRLWICNQIASLLARIYSTNSFVLAVIPNIAYEFEAQVFEEMAKSEVDYLRKILFKLFSFFGDFKPICLTKDDQTASSSSSFQSVSTPNATTNDSIQGNELMPQYSNCTAVPIDFHQNPAISLHNAQDVLNSLSENTVICTGNCNQGMDWKEETIQEINYLVMTYGKRLRDIYCWVNEGPKTKGRSLLKMDRIPRWKDELDSILNILTGKELLSLELKENITFVEKRILYYINLKELFDCSQEIFSKLDTLSPDELQTSMLNEFIKAFLMEKAKKLGVDIHLVEDNYAGCAITYSLSREITEIINEWCDHKIRILTQTRPTMEDIEKELSIWQTPGSKLQQWCLLKHLPMKLGPIRQHPDLLFEEVCSIWELHNKIELKQASLFQWHQQQLVDPAWKPTSPVPRPVDPTTEELDATQQKARLFQQMSPDLEQLQYHGFSRKAGPKQAIPTLLQFGSVSELPFPMPQQMGSALQQLQHYQGFSRDRPRKQANPAPPRLGSVSELPAPKPQQTDHALQQLHLYRSFSKHAGPTPPQFGSVSKLPGSKPEQMDHVHQPFQQSLGTSQHTDTMPKQPELSHLYFIPQEPVPVPVQQRTDTASPTESSHVGGPRIMPAAA